MTSLAIAMGEVLLMWGAIGAAITGIGLLWRKVFRVQEWTAGDGLITFWSGFAILLAFLQFWRFALAIDGGAFAVFLVVGAIGLIANWRDIALLAREQLARHRGVLIVLALFAIWISNRAIGPGNAEDSGLYHYRAIRWATAYPIIPGIGNLSAALALNNVSFLFDAMLDTGRWHGSANHLANGLLLLGLFAGIIPAIGRLLRGDRRFASDAYLLALLPIAIYLLLGKDVPSPKTDLPVGCMTFVTVYAAVRMLEESACNFTARRFQIITLALLASAAVCLKFSSIVVVSLTGIIVLVEWLRRDAAARARWMSIVSPIVAVIVLLIGPWIAANIVMSGYPLYPAKVASVNVEWKVPPAAVDYIVGSIRNQAKAGLILWAYDNLSHSKLAPYARLMKPAFTDRDHVVGLQWVRPWLFSLPITSAIEVCLPALIGFIALIMVLRRRKRSAITWLLVPTLAGVAFWLWAGPEPRYGWQIMWALAGVLVAMGVESRELFSPNRARRLVYAIILLSLPGIIYHAGVEAMLRHANPLAEIPFLPPGPDGGFYPKPTQSWMLIHTNWGTPIYVPDREDQPLSWDGPLPCTAWPPLDMNVRLRKQGDLSRGFVTDPHPARSVTQAYHPLDAAAD